MKSPEHQRRPTRAWKTGVIALMWLGGIAMWVLNPMWWLWVTSHLEDSTQPSMGPYGLLLLGVILTCVAIGKGLAELNRYYARVCGTTPTVRVILPWRRSLRGGRSLARETDGRLPISVLDVIMVTSVVIAATALLVWLIVVNPTPPGIQGPGPAK